ncbi:hypothetical protein ACHAXT_008836 [Thalassiosira profunda]
MIATTVMDGIRRGESSETEYAAYEICGASEDKEGTRETCLELLIDLALIPTVLDFLHQCGRDITEVRAAPHPGNASFREICEGQTLLREIAKGPVTEPGHWLGILCNITLDTGLLTTHRLEQCRMEVAKSIGPIVNCMSSDAREFFRDERHWLNAALPFLTMVKNISASGAGAMREVMSRCNEQKFIRLLAQFMFWREHPHIAEGWEQAGRVDKLEEIAKEAESVLLTAMAIDAGDMVPTGQVCLDEREKRRLRRIGLMPIGAAMHSADDTIPLTIGLVRRLRHQSATACTMLKLLVNADSVDKDVISGVIDSAKKVSTSEIAIEIASIMIDICIPLVGGKPCPNDNHFAFAIDKGILEVCVKLLLRFRDASNSALFGNLQYLIDIGTYGVSVKVKSSKALVRQCGRVLKAVQRAENSLASSGDDCKKVLRSIKMIVLLTNGIDYFAKKFCSYCTGYLAKDETTKCSGCKEYENQFSLEGQTDEAEREEKLDRRERILCQNARAAVDKLVLENRLGLLAQATLQGHDILDCVVSVNLRHFPALSVLLASDFIESIPSAEERTHLRDTVDRNRSNGCLSSYIQSPSYRGLGINIMQDQHANPCSCCSWQDAQATFKANEWPVLENATAFTEEIEETFGVFFSDWFERKWAPEVASTDDDTNERMSELNRLGATIPSFNVDLIKAVQKRLDEIRATGGDVNALEVWKATNEYIETAKEKKEEEKV